METKVCKRCERELPTTEFSKDRSYPDGLNYICKECQRKAQRESYERRKATSVLHSEELQKFSPRELMDEHVIATDGDTVETDWYDYELNIWASGRNVTHWMPLPEKPTKK